MQSNRKDSRFLEAWQKTHFFCLCVDNFGVKNWTKRWNQSCKELGWNFFRHTVDVEGNNYCDLTLDLKFILWHVDVSMPKCLPDALKPLKHFVKVNPQHSPHECLRVTYEKNSTPQLAKNPSEDCLPKTDVTCIQSVLVSFLFYASAIDHTMLLALKETSRTQEKTNTHTKE